MMRSTFKLTLLNFICPVTDFFEAAGRYMGLVRCRLPTPTFRRPFFIVPFAPQTPLPT